MFVADSLFSRLKQSTGAERVGECDQSVPRPRPCHEAACQPQNGTMEARRRRAMVAPRWTMVIQKPREASWKHVCHAANLQPMRVVRRDRAERRPGMGPRSGPSGAGHRRSLRVAPSGASTKTHALVSSTKTPILRVGTPWLPGPPTGVAPTEPTAGPDGHLVIQCLEPSGP